MKLIEANKVLREALEAVQSVANGSDGIAGWHKNGDIASWESILPEIDDALDATADIEESAAPAASTLSEADIIKYNFQHVNSIDFARAVERHVLAGSSQQVASAPADPVLLQTRWLDIHPMTVTTGKWSEWEVVDQRKYAETVDLIERGYTHYEVRQLYAMSQPASTQPTDPMDWPLPCDVTVGHGTMRKGIPLSALVARMKVLYSMVRELSPKQELPDIFAAMQSIDEAAP